MKLTKSTPQSALKQPTALWLVALCYALFMGGGGMIMASTVLYAKSLGFPTGEAYSIFAAAMALFWILPLGGGYLAGRYGYTQASMIGLMVTVVGMLLFAFGGAAYFYLGLALFLVGNAFITPSIMCLLDFAYTKDDCRREAGFTLFYLSFNVGAVLGVFVGGALSTCFGYDVEFGLGAAFLGLALVVFGLGQYRYLTVDPTRVKEAAVRPTNLKNLSIFFGAIIITGVVVCQLFQYLLLCNVFITIVFVLTIAFMLYRSNRYKGAVRRRFLAFIALAIAAIVFWTLYTLEPSLLSVFISHDVDRRFLGINIPANAFFAFDGVFVIILGLIMSRVWLWLSVRDQNPGLIQKFIVSIFVMAIGFVFLAMMIHFNGLGVRLPAHYIVLAYAIFAFAELLVGPLGISMVGQLSPPGMEGVLMGFWQLCIGFAGLVSGWVENTMTHAHRANPLTERNYHYAQGFFHVGAWTVAVGIAITLVVIALHLHMRKKAWVLPQL